MILFAIAICAAICFAAVMVAGFTVAGMIQDRANAKARIARAVRPVEGRAIRYDAPSRARDSVGVN